MYMHMKYVRSRAHECVYIIADYFKQSLRLVVLYYNIGTYIILLYTFYVRHHCRIIFLKRARTAWHYII